MSFVGIIIGVIVFLFYIARSVEKQNAQERKRREQRRGSGSVLTRKMPEGGSLGSAEREKGAPLYSDSSPEPATENAAGGGDLMKRYRKAVDRASGTDIGSVPEPGPAMLHSLNRQKRPEWMRDRRAARQAFIFAECIGKPRAVEKHPYFTQKRSNK